MAVRLRLVMEVKCAASEEMRRANLEYSESLGLPVVVQSPLKDKKLAVVGGGPSVANHLDELREWDGDIWAISDAAGWLHRQGIKSTLVVGDPTRWEGEGRLARMVEGVTDALLASTAHSELYDALPSASIRRFHIDPIAPGEEIAGGVTMAARAPVLGLMDGYADQSYFGCEGSFSDETHVYSKFHDPRNDLTIETDSGEFRSTLQLMWQSEALSVLMRRFPDRFKDRSGGLLGAMIADQGWGVVDMTDDIREIVDTHPAFRQQEIIITINPLPRNDDDSIFIFG